VCAASTRRDAARALIAYMASPETAQAKREQGLEPA
jgi:molybdate transport system substrate-binding protein